MLLQMRIARPGSTVLQLPSALHDGAAVLLNLTVTGAAGNGHLTVDPFGSPPIGTSTLNSSRSDAGNRVLAKVSTSTLAARRSAVLRWSRIGGESLHNRSFGDVIKIGCVVLAAVSWPQISTADQARPGCSARSTRASGRFAEPSGSRGQTRNASASSAARATRGRSRAVG